MASKSTVTTYVERRRETEKLAAIDRKIEQFVLGRSSFENDPAFQKLNTDYLVQFNRVRSLSEL
jgi:hypothetical protein